MVMDMDAFHELREWTGSGVGVCKALHWIVLL